MAETLRNRDSFAKVWRPALFTLGLVMGIRLTAATLSPEAQMEAATYREAVLGDLKGAIEQYKTVLGLERNLQGSKPRAVTARALFKMGECYEKLGRRAEAQALYTRLIAEFSDQTEFSAQARVRLAAWADTLPSPPQLNFALGGPGDVPAGWFMPVLPKDSGCPAGLSCTVVLVPDGAPMRVTGDFIQSFSAAAYRSKTVKLRARVRVEGDPAQLWISVDRTKGAGDRVSDRAVAAGDWTVSTVSVHIEDDATLLNFGVSSAGHGHVYVDDVSLEILPH
jgi:hypothetical protein